MQEAQETSVQSLVQEDFLETEMATHSSIFAWETMDRGTWWSIVHGVTKSQTQLSHWVHTHNTTNTLQPGGSNRTAGCLLACSCQEKRKSTCRPPSPSDPPAHLCWRGRGSNSEKLRHTVFGPRLPGFHLAPTPAFCLRVRYLSNGDKSHGLRSHALMWKNIDNSLAIRKHQRSFNKQIRVIF